ncbi:MAG TPA: regulatory protein RecX [Candidatus Polarisedimenticolaceae bacterium]|nr:regulatory protein RecX [Candidatus Polarisedimenticolaceae bacterium]
MPDSEEEALQSALRFLSFRPRSEAELLAHLSRKGYSATAREKALEKLRSLNYINDEAFARSWTLSRAAGRKYGPKRIEQELKAKGVGQPLIRDVIGATFAHGDEEKNAKKLLEKKFKGVNFGDPKVLRRASAFLARRGYSSQVIFSLMRRRPEDDLEP